MPEKTRWKAGNIVLPAPAALVSCADGEGRANLITIAWCGNINTNPAMVSISVMPSRFSHGMLVETGEFVVNLPSRRFARAVDFCGVRSGRDVDKWETCGLTPLAMERVGCPGVNEFPVNIGCRVKDRIALGSHDMFLAVVEEVAVDAALVDAGGRFDLERAELLCYAHGQYYGLGERRGFFGFSVRKKKSASGGKRKRKR